MKLTTRCPNADCRQPIILHLSRNEQKELSRRLILETTCGACGSGVRLQLANDISIISAVTTGPASRADRSLALDRETFAAAAPPPPASAAPVADAPPPPLPAASAAAAPFSPLSKAPAASSGVAPGFSPAAAMPPAPERPAAPAPAPFSPAPAAAVPDFRPIAPGPEARPGPQGGEPVKVPAFAVLGADGPQRRGRSGRGTMERLTDSFSQRPKWQQYAILGLLFLGVMAILAFPTKKPPKRTPTTRAVPTEAEPERTAPPPMTPAAPGDSVAPAAGGAKTNGNAEPAAPGPADGAPEKAPQ
ncbi:hypothetical protein [Planctomyces sp. SH-PL14]|uniref:hypothetical protein n=1 Tax=Planctomyces sp. SH-PL14 TaxID=1632864 RepID=UPI00078E087C|nr:hypothetical protein [Planctomyces sp. SH-PL14]AMV22519.1 hypothetical protein VT03_31780 [Planctomyces sp. SH-PL14]